MVQAQEVPRAKLKNEKAETKRTRGKLRKKQ
jgi:hypothetical protein